MYIPIAFSPYQLVSTKPYVRKRAVLLMYKIFLKVRYQINSFAEPCLFSCGFYSIRSCFSLFYQFPESLRPAFPRLKDKLEDPDSGKYKAF